VSVAVPSRINSPNRTGVLCAGAVVLDTLVRPFDELHWGTTTFIESVEPRVGGSAANTARALGILGVPVRIFAVLGPDDAADTIRQELSRCNVDLSCIETVPEPTPQTIVLVNRAGDRQFLHRRGCSEVAFSTGLSFTPAIISRMAHFHLAGLFVIPHVRTQAPAMLREAGLTTSLDTCWDPQAEWMKVLEPCLPELDILFMNEDEAAQIGAGQSTTALAHGAMEKGTGMVVMKRSREGCRVYTSRQEIICPAYDVEPRDTTGAGDCFVAGFLAAHLEGAAPERAGPMGNAAGALSVLHIGAVEGLIPRPQMESWMAQTSIRQTDPRTA
jgi:sugar/nucleoside kinase (ribokinase family)